MNAATKKPTKRQSEVLVNIFLGDRWDVSRGDERYSWVEGDDKAVIPPWGRPSRYGYKSSMGGALRRMREAMAEAGWLQYKISERGSTWVYDRLTVQALEFLKSKFPTLPNIDQRIADQRAADQEAADQEAREREQMRERLAQGADRRKADRIERMEAVLRDYQVRHDLKPDQLLSMWNRIAEEEMREVK